MTVLDVDACACGQPATRTLGARPYCDECAEQVLAPIRAKHPSNGQQTGPLRPDYGPGWAELTCTTCGGQWVGRIGETCGWCVTELDKPRREKLRLAPPPNTNGDHEATQDPISDDPDQQLRDMLIAWPAFWAHDHQDAEWLAEPVLPANRSTALFAPGGTGKSLLALWLAAKLATGCDPFTGHRQPPVDVLYLDYEMTEADLAERLEQMGFGPDDDLTHLHYALLPSLPGLDQPDGGRAVVRLADLCDARLCIIDTFGRAVHGDENDADTVRAWYRWTGLHLKHDGRAFLRVDHAGKDLAKGQRGSSAKNDDVDVVWQMTAKDGNTYKLDAKKRRMGWVPLTVDIAQTDDPLGYTLLNGETWPAGTKETATALDELCLADDTGVRTAARALRDAGHRARQDVIRAAVKYRKRRTTNTVDNLGISVTRLSGNAKDIHRPVTVNVTPDDTPPNQAVTPAVTPGNTMPPQMGNSVPLSERHALPVDPEPDHWEPF